MLTGLVEYIIKQLVESQESVKVETKQDGSQLCIQILIDSKDRGRIIGRDGQTIKALKAFLGCIMPGTHITIDLIQNPS
ncbi:MAG TPA: KH domain-containing protein [Candidatus Babeliales bacterium]|jgi:hypothetical protein|nr:KH domain-containing protein [Candidatus Babeliales bacterium]